jgi:hypothetical protein
MIRRAFMYMETGGTVLEGDLPRGALESEAA